MIVIDCLDTNSGIFFQVFDFFNEYPDVVYINLKLEKKGKLQVFLIIAVEQPKLISVDSCKTNDCTSIGSVSIIIHSNISNKWSNMIMYIALRVPLDLSNFPCFC